MLISQRMLCGRRFGVVEAYGPAARRFVENCRWDGVVDEFEEILEDVIWK